MAVDWDETFAYSTFKVVRVKDRFLGLIRLTFMLLIAVYIFVKVLFIDKSYRATETPIGTVRSSIKFPTTAIDASTYGYCDGANWPYPAENFPCSVWDEHAVRYPLEEVDGMFITTRVATSTQEFACGAPGETAPCAAPFVDTAAPVTNFLAGVETFSIGIQHAFTTPQFALESSSSSYAGSSNAYNGVLVDVTGKTLLEFPADKTSDKPDVMTLNDLLAAARVSLSDVSPDPNNSLRYSGLVFIAKVEYSNNDGATRYTYRVSAIPRADYKAYELVRTGGATDPRTLYKRAGAKIIFVVSGEIGKFDFQTLLLQLVSAMGLLSVSTVLVELLMLYIMPLRAKYRAAKFEETEDFSDVRDNEKAAAAAGGAVNEGIVMQRSSSGTMEEPLI